MKNTKLFYFFPLGDEKYKIIFFLPPGGMKNTKLFYFFPLGDEKY
jgi:hypothetical protein